MRMRHSLLSDQRTKEVNDKTEQATKEVLGDRKDSMIYLANVCTAPEKQGRGYASTLIRIVTAKVAVFNI